MEALILADDLSGAADTAAAAGCDAVVALDWPPPTEATITAIDLNSRKQPAAEAAALAACVIEGLARRETKIYHKIDSIMRGNWPEELDAIQVSVGMRRGRKPLAVIAPAWPERGRITVDGKVQVNDTALSSTGLSGDDGRPLDGSIPNRLRAWPEVALISAGMAARELHGRMQASLDAGHAAVICDAQSRAHLDAVAAASAELRDEVVWVGSGGLMGSLSKVLGWRRELSLPKYPAGGGPVLVVVGSASRIAQEQLQQLEHHGVPGALIAADDLSASSPPGALAALVAEIGMELVAGRSMAVGIKGNPTPDHQIGAALVRRLAEAVAPLLVSVGGLVLTGGETARAVLSTGGIGAIRVIGEIEPGVPLGVTVGALTLPVVTKAGAFGGPTTLVAAVTAMLNGFPAFQSLRDKTGPSI